MRKIFFVSAVLLHLSSITANAQSSNPLTVEQGGTGANNATDARANLAAATRGTNSDITSITGLTTPLSASQGGTGSVAGVSPTGPLRTTPEGVVNIADYGGCSGSVTSDTANVNAALAAARSSFAYLNNQPVRIVGGFSTTGVGCAVTQINATGFTRFGTGSRLIIEDMTLQCSGTGNICLDALGSLNIQFNKLTIIGSSSSPPMIGMQEGNTTPANFACCIHTHYGLEISGSFTFAGLYSAASESTTYYSPIIRNNGAALGVIGTLGSITPGSGYGNGTHIGVSLTGSATGSGAVANVVVSGGAVTSVTITSQGKQYSIGDTLSASAASLGGSGSGFSVQVTNIGQFAMVMDGQNHWGVSSSFQTVSWPLDTYYTFTENNIVAGSLRYYPTTYKGAPLWIASVAGLRTTHTYMAQQSAGPCISMFDSNATNTSHNTSETFEIECESATATYDVQLTGPYATPDVSGFTLSDPLSTVSTAILGVDSGITSVTAHNANVNVGHTAFSPTLFGIGSAFLWNFDGVASMPAAWQYNAPTSRPGLVTGASGGVPYATGGPLDFLTSITNVSAAYSCARKLFTQYQGPLCNIRRGSDSTAIDFYANASGVIDKSMLTVFCANTLCYIVTEYDQSYNNNNATNATASNQPALNIEGSLNYSLCGVWGNGSNISLSVNSNSAINALFASGGFASIVTSQRALPSNAMRLLSKTSGSTGWELSGAYSLGFGYPQFTVDASGTNGSWVSSTLMPSNGGHIFDVTYNYASLSNIPTLAIDGVALSYQSTTQPSGTIFDGSNLVIGNNASGGFGWPGDICEVILTRQPPSAAQLDAIRRNQAVFYGLGGVL